jgi:hypothetical protein
VLLLVYSLQAEGRGVILYTNADAFAEQNMGTA